MGVGWGVVGGFGSQIIINTWIFMVPVITDGSANHPKHVDSMITMTTVRKEWFHLSAAF